MRGRGRPIVGAPSAERARATTGDGPPGRGRGGGDAAAGDRRWEATGSHGRQRPRGVAGDPGWAAPPFGRASAPESLQGVPDRLRDLGADIVESLDPLQVPGILPRHLFQEASPMLPLPEGQPLVGDAEPLTERPVVRGMLVAVRVQAVQLPGQMPVAVALGRQDRRRGPDVAQCRVGLGVLAGQIEPGAGRLARWDSAIRCSPRRPNCSSSNNRSPIRKVAASLPRTFDWTIARS